MRQNWDRYFIDIAHMIASRATCDRLFAGAVIVKNNMILSTGYNGSIRGLSHCSEVGHEMVNDHCLRTIHAEINAIAQAARVGVSVEEAIMYSTVAPCYICFKAIANTGIKAIVHDGIYDKITYYSQAEEAGIILEDISKRET